MFLKSILKDFVVALEQLDYQDKQNALSGIQQLCHSSGYIMNSKADRGDHFANEVRIPVLGKMRHILVKYHLEASEIEREASKMEALKSFKKINMPKLYGAAKHWLVTEYVNGKTTDHRNREKMLLAVDHLLDIQISDITDLKSNASFQKEASVQRELVQFLDNIKSAIMNSPEYLGEIPGAWVDNLEEIASDSNALVCDITNPDEESLVLSHGDYKPDNLVFALTGENSWKCYPVDWVYAAIRPRWYDITSLTEGCVDNEGLADLYWNRYCEGIVSIDRIQAERFYFQHKLLAALRVANANATLSDHGKVKEFKRCLNSLGFLLDKLRNVNGR